MKEFELFIEIILTHKFNYFHRKLFPHAFVQRDTKGHIIRMAETIQIKYWGGGGGGDQLVIVS